MTAVDPDMMMLGGVVLQALRCNGDRRGVEKSDGRKAFMLLQKHGIRKYHRIDYLIGEGREEEVSDGLLENITISIGPWPSRSDNDLTRLQRFWEVVRSFFCL